MRKTETFVTSYGGIENINDFDYKFGVSILNPSGATEYGLRFYRFPDFDTDETERLSASRGEYEIISAYEDCEIGSVEFLIGHSFYRLDFAHDGDEPFRATFSKLTKPEDWSYEKTLQFLRSDIDEETATAFVADRIKHHQFKFESESEAMKQFDSYFYSFAYSFYKPTLWMI